MNEYTIHRDEDSLSHYGVPGTKWGVRRYQNKDGSYKPGAEGRYYQAVPDSVRKITINAATKTAAKAAGAKIAATKMASAIAGGKSVSGGGGGTAAKKEAQPINKTVLGKDIDVKDASQKLDTSSSKEKKSSTKKAKDESAGNEEFKLSQLEDKINNLFDMDDMKDEDWEDMDLDQSDIDEIDSLITKYRAWRKGNKSNTKKLKKIDEFIERYESWKSGHSKHSEMRELYLMHHGILGMHWGIRRYQNKDGSLTAEGRKRYLTSSGSLSEKGQKEFRKQWEKTTKTWDENRGKFSNKKYEKIRDANAELKNTINALTDFKEQNLKISKEFDKVYEKLENLDPGSREHFYKCCEGMDDACILEEMCRGSYDDFIKQLDEYDQRYTSKGYEKNLASDVKNNGDLERVYNYGKKGNEAFDEMVKQLDDLTLNTVEKLSSSKEEQAEITSFINTHLRFY